jgi:hypothetical protein
LPFFRDRNTGVKAPLERGSMRFPHQSIQPDATWVGKNVVRATGDEQQLAFGKRCGRG